MTPGEDQRFDWRRGGAAAIALVATLVLLGMVVLVAMTNSARDRRCEAERHAYDVTLLTRTADASIARAEAAVGRYALDEDAAIQRQPILCPMAAGRAAAHAAGAVRFAGS